MSGLECSAGERGMPMISGTVSDSRMVLSGHSMRNLGPRGKATAAEEAASDYNDDMQPCHPCSVLLQQMTKG